MTDPNTPEAVEPEQAKGAVEASSEDLGAEKKGSGKRWYRGRYSNSKRFRQAASQVDRSRLYNTVEAFELLLSLNKPKFNEAVECVVRLGIDPKKTDQLVRGAVSLPHGIGKEIRVVVFAEGEKAEQAKAAGADEVGSADLAKKIEGGWLDFDVAIASPDMMKYVGKLGRVLGPQGKMPSPKAGTVTMDVGTAVSEFKAGKVEFRTDAGANVHAAIGRRNFTAEQLAENAAAFVTHLRSLKPAQAKGLFIQKVVVSSTMGPGIRLSLAEEAQN